MSLFDGTDDELTYAQALVEIAKLSGRTEAQSAELVRAIQKEHGILPLEPDDDPEDTPIDVELKALRAEKAARDKAAEVEALKAELAEPAKPVKAAAAAAKS